MKKKMIKKEYDNRPEKGDAKEPDKLHCIILKNSAR